MNRCVVFGLAGVLGLGSLAACGDDVDTATEVKEANAVFCDNLAGYASALDSLAALDPTTATKSDYDAAVDEVRTAREDLSSSASDLAEAERTNLEAQAEDLDGLLADAPDDQAVADIVAGAQAQVDEVKASIAALDTAVCTEGNTTAITGG